MGLLSGIKNLASSVTGGDILSFGGKIASGLLGKTDQDVDWSGSKEGISWKVRDAKRAGIHPLYAIGAPTIGGIMQSGENALGRAVGEATDQLGRSINRRTPTQVQAAQINHLQAQTQAARMQAYSDWAQAQYQLSRTAKMTQELHQGGQTRKSNVQDLETVPAGAEMSLSHGRKKKTESARTSLDEIEKIYGDVLSPIYGIGNWLEDTFSPLGRAIGKEAYRLLNRKRKSYTTIRRY